MQQQYSSSTVFSVLSTRDASRQGNANSSQPLPSSCTHDCCGVPTSKLRVLHSGEVPTHTPEPEGSPSLIQARLLRKPATSLNPCACTDHRCCTCVHRNGS